MEEEEENEGGGAGGEEEGQEGDAGRPGGGGEHNGHLPPDSLPELQKASSTSSAELDFFENFCQICPVFRIYFYFLSFNIQVRNNVENIIIIACT